MAYVNVPKDLNKIKSKFALGLTGSQILHILVGASIGVPLFFATRHTLGNGPAMLLLFACVAPFAFLALYEKDGQPAKKWIAIILRHKIYPHQRLYETQNFYNKINCMAKEERIDQRKKTNANYSKRAPNPKHKGRSTK